MGSDESEIEKAPHPKKDGAPVFLSVLIRLR
jgi:hypothetical protein